MRIKGTGAHSTLRRDSIRAGEGDEKYTRKTQGTATQCGRDTKEEYDTTHATVDTDKSTTTSRRRGVKKLTTDRRRAKRKRRGHKQWDHWAVLRDDGSKRRPSAGNKIHKGDRE